MQKVIPYAYITPSNKPVIFKPCMSLKKNKNVFGREGSVPTIFGH